jgi:hypothetical protein
VQQQQHHHHPRKNRRLSQAETEKIQIAIENGMMRFPNKSIMEKIIEYINFESSHKYTLVVSSSNANSRPVTRGKSHSPVGVGGGGRALMPDQHKNSLHHQSQTLILTSESKRSLNEMESSAEAVDHVLTKVMTDDEAMIVELRNAARSRNSLRSKHMEQLEETKANLSEIKSKAAKTLLSDESSGDIDFPQDGPTSN